MERASALAEFLPEHKHAAVAVLRRRGWTVGACGAGVDDAATLRAADAGIASHGGVVQVETQTRVEIAWFQLLKLKYDKLLSFLAINFGVCLYSAAPMTRRAAPPTSCWPPRASPPSCWSVNPSTPVDPYFTSA